MRRNPCRIRCAARCHILRDEVQGVEISFPFTGGEVEVGVDQVESVGAALEPAVIDPIQISGTGRAPAGGEREAVIQRPTTPA